MEQETQLSPSIFVIILTWVAGIDGYCFSGSPSLTCISPKFDLYVYLWYILLLLSLTNRATRSQVAKVTKHGTNPYFVWYGFLLVCYSYYVRKTRLSDIRLQIRQVPAPQIQLWCWHCAPYKCSYYYYYYYYYYVVTLKTGLRVREGHWKCHHSIQSLWLPIDVP